MAERPILFSAPMVRAILAGKKTQTRRLVTRGTASCGSAPWAWLRFDEAFPTSNGAHTLLVPGDHPDNPGDGAVHRVHCRIQPGDLLWVRETWGFRGGSWCNRTPTMQDVYIAYRADPDPNRTLRTFRKRSENHSAFPGLPKQPAGGLKDYAKWWASWRPSIFLPRWASRITLAIDSVRVERLQAITEEDARAEGVEHHKPAEGDQNGLVNAARYNYERLWDKINGKRAPWATNPWVWVIGWVAT